MGGELAFTAGSERFYNVAEKVQNILTLDDGSVSAFPGGDYDATTGNYMYIFSVQRSLFPNAEISKTQEDYVTTIYQEALAFSIPVNCKTAECSATVIDALSYEGIKSVVPVYREKAVEQKGLRDDDSIEMLGIITDGAYMDLGTVYGLNSGFITEYNAEMKARNGKMASLIASWEKTLNTSIEELNETLLGK